MTNPPCSKCGAEDKPGHWATERGVVRVWAPVLVVSFKIPGDKHLCRACLAEYLRSLAREIES